eukprot:gene24619-biopygen11919
MTGGHFPLVAARPYHALRTLLLQQHLLRWFPESPNCPRTPGGRMDTSSTIMIAKPGCHAAWLPLGCRLAAAQGFLGRPGAGLPPAKPGCRVAAAQGCLGRPGAGLPPAKPGQAGQPRGSHAAAWLRRGKQP